MVAAEGAFGCNEEYPLKFTPDAPPPFVRFVGAPPYRGKAPRACGAVLAIPFVVDRPGTYTLSGVFKYSVSSADAVELEQVQLSITVEAR